MCFLSDHFGRRLLRCWDNEMRPQPSSIAAAEKGHHRGARLITVALAALVALGGNAAAMDAPDAPGGWSSWTTGAKQGLGTSTTVQSKVWYTIAEGIVTEVYYPEVDVPNVQDLQLIVTDGRTFVDLERDATTHQVELADTQALTYRQVNTDKTDTPRYRITRILVTDPDRPVLLIETRFEMLSGGPYQVYVLYNPSLNGSGLFDTAATSGNALVGNDGNVAMPSWLRPASRRCRMATV